MAGNKAIPYSSSGNSGRYPRITGSMVNTRAQNSAEGFLANGDRITLPSSNTASLVYYDNTGSVVWTKAITNIDATADGWAGFMFDSVDDLLWCAGIDDGTDDIYLAHINAAGTITNVGNFIPTAAISASSDGWMGNNGCAVLTRATEGTGNFFLNLNNERFEINYTTGAKVSETNVQNLKPGAYISTKGYYFNMYGVNAVTSIDLPVCTIGKINPQVANEVTLIQVPLPRDIGITYAGTSISTAFVPWKGDIFAYAGAGGTATHAPLFNATAFDTWVNDLAASLGF